MNNNQWFCQTFHPLSTNIKQHLMSRSGGIQNAHRDSNGMSKWVADIHSLHVSSRACLISRSTTLAHILAALMEDVLGPQSLCFKYSYTHGFLLSCQQLERVKLVMEGHRRTNGKALAQASLPCHRRGLFKKKNGTRKFMKDGLLLFWDFLMSFPLNLPLLIFGFPFLLLS